MTVNWTTIPDNTSEYAITPGAEFITTGGRFGDATVLGLDGVESYIDCGNDVSLNLATITVGGWVKTNSTTTDQIILAKWREQSNRCEYKLGLNSANKAVFTVSDDGKASNAVSITGNTAVGTGWNHIVGLYDGGFLKIYLNGLEDQTALVYEDGINAKTAVLRLGCQEAATPEYFNGLADEVRIYNAAVSADRIRARYLGALSAHKNADSNLVLHCGAATMTTSVSGLTGWHHVAATYDNTPGKAYLYLDGVQKVEASFSGGTRRIFGNYAYLGNDEYNQMRFDGKMDEARISSTARSGDWISTSHNNQNSPSTFYEVKGATGTGGTDPVPELPTVILFAVGLLVLAGYVMLRRKKNK